MRELLALLLMFFFCEAASASKVKDLSDKWSFRIGTSLPSLPLKLQGADDSQQVDYEQNGTNKFGAGIDHSWWGFYLSLEDTGAELDESLYGTTDYFDFQLHTYLGHWGVDLYWQDFKGYYSSSPSVTSGNPLLRPDLETEFIGANIFYVIHPDEMSLVATGTGTAMQTESGGSWMYYLGGARQRILSDAVIAPAGFENEYGRIGNMQNASFYTFVVGGGYGYNFVLGGPWYFHISAQGGLGPQRQVYATRDFGDFDTWMAVFKGTSRAAIGFSGEDWFGAVTFVGDTTTFTIDATLLDFTSVQAFAYIGIRYDL